MQFDTVQLGREVAVAPELPFEDGLRQRAEQESVVGRHQVNRPAHDADPHDLAALERRESVAGRKPSSRDQSAV